MKKLSFLLFMVLAFTLLSPNNFAQDATVVDPEHYKLEFENDQVRVLRINYGPGEKSVMHSHPESVVVFMNDGDGKFTYPDGKTEDIKFTDGTVLWIPATTHQPENIGKDSFEVIQIEMKSKED